MASNLNSSLCGKEQADLSDKAPRLKISSGGGKNGLATESTSNILTDGTKKIVEVQTKDTITPIHSVKSLEALFLNPEILNDVYEISSNVVMKVMQILLAETSQDVIIHLWSKTGINAISVLAMMSRVDTSKNYPQVVYLLPAELASVIEDIAQKMAPFYPGIKICYRVEGKEVSRNSDGTEHVIITTPSYVIQCQMLKSSSFNFKMKIDKVRLLIVNRSSCVKFKTPIWRENCMSSHDDVYWRHRSFLSPDCQIMSFSLTCDRKGLKMEHKTLKNPVLITYKEEDLIDNIKQYYEICRTTEKKYTVVTKLYRIITTSQTAVIFCHIPIVANWLAEKITKDGHRVMILNGESMLDQRISVLNRFRQGEEKILIVTNMLIRGLNMGHVKTVINFDLPVNMYGDANCETYFHRITKAGRGGKPGLAINLVDTSGSMAVVHEIQKHFGKTIKLLNADKEDEIKKVWEQIKEA